MSKLHARDETVLEAYRAAKDAPLKWNSDVRKAEGGVDVPACHEECGQPKHHCCEYVFVFSR